MAKPQIERYQVYAHRISSMPTTLPAKYNTYVIRSTKELHKNVPTVVVESTMTGSVFGVDVHSSGTLDNRHKLIASCTSLKEARNTAALFIKELHDVFGFIVSTQADGKPFPYMWCIDTGKAYKTRASVNANTNYINRLNAEWADKAEEFTEACKDVAEANVSSQHFGDSLPPITGIPDTEQAVIADILARQKMGIQKYGTTLANNPIKLRAWLQHSLEEQYDNMLYTKRAIQELDLMAEQAKE